MTPQPEMPALVAHILHDLEANYGFIDLMAGSYHPHLFVNATRARLSGTAR